MVYLNKIVSVDIKILENIILEKMEEKIENELDYVHNINDARKDQIKKNILKEMKLEIKKDIFIYRIMDRNKCVYKHKRGKHNGKFCHNNITNNGDSKKWLCRTHNKNHVPKPKIINKNNEYIKNNTNLEIISSITNINENTKLPPRSKNKFKNNFKSNLKNKTYYIKDIKLNNIKNIIISYSSNIICKYNNHELCHNIFKHGRCDFKHINNISLNNFIDDNNNISKISV